MAKSSQVKSKERVAAHGEVFTAECEVKAMCHPVADECSRIESRFLEPACGNGYFLAEVLSRKLESCKNIYGSSRPDYEAATLKAVMSIYGVELLADNAAACRERLFKIWGEACNTVCGEPPSRAIAEAVRFVLAKNILCGDALTMKQADGTPIIFAEWAFIDGVHIKRRDYRLDKLIEANEKQKAALLPVEDEFVAYDWDKREFIPKPVKEYAPIDYRRICERA